ncbi:MAG: helix-turn-helix domain-containing protein [Thermofilaceae archaeon]
MPRRRYDDAVLREKAVELREKGYTYRQIAEVLGCSTYKVWELLSGYSEVRSRVKQFADLFGRVDRLLAQVKELEDRLGSIKRLGHGSLQDAVLELHRRVSDIEREIDTLRKFAKMRVKGKYSCVHVNERGLCGVMRLSEEISQLSVEEVGGVYYLKVSEQPLLCVACPRYKPSTSRYESSTDKRSS